jgi:hypothetical protein
VIDGSWQGRAIKGVRGRFGCRTRAIKGVWAGSVCCGMGTHTGLMRPALLVRSVVWQVGVGDGSSGRRLDRERTGASRTGGAHGAARDHAGPRRTWTRLTRSVGWTGGSG